MSPSFPRRQFLATAGWTVAAALVGACRTPPEPLRVGLPPWPANDLYFLAQELGHYEGLSVRLVDYASALQQLRAFRNAVLEAAPCTLDEALVLALDVPDLRVVQVIDFSYGADVILAQADIPSMEALRGRKIGYEATALGAYVLGRGLELSGMTVADVTPVNLPVDEHERAFVERRVDAVVTYEPTRSRLLGQGARTVFDSTRIPREVVDVLVARAAVLERSAAQLQGLVRGWLLAAEVLRTRPDEAKAILARHMTVPADEVLGTFGGIQLVDLAENRRVLDGDPPPILEVARRLSRTMLANRFIDREPDLARLFDARVVMGVTLPVGG